MLADRGTLPSPVRHRTGECWPQERLKIAAGEWCSVYHYYGSSPVIFVFNTILCLTKNLVCVPSRLLYTYSVLRDTRRCCWR